MSERCAATQASLRARDVETNAAAWIARHDSGAMSDEDRAKFDAWLAESLAHRVAFWRLNAAWSRTKRLAALRQPDHDAAEKHGGSRSRRNIARAAIGAAAIALVCIGAIYLIERPVAQTYATEIGGHQLFKLADGTLIELNTDTRLRASVSSQSRTVWLDKGEAYFQVKRDANRPFTVISGDRSVTDLGTSFTVRRDSDRLKIAVVQGRVLFDTIDRTKSPTLLTEGDTAIVTGNSLSVTKNSPRKLAEDTAWRRGVLVFDQVTLADAAAEFNRYNREQVVVLDQNVAHRTIGATFPIHDVEQFVDVTQEVLGLHVEKHGDQIVISR